MDYKKQFNEEYWRIFWDSPQRYCYELSRAGLLKDGKLPKYINTNNDINVFLAIDIISVLFSFVGFFSYMGALKYVILLVGISLVYVFCRFVMELNTFYYMPRKRYVKQLIAEDTPAQEQVEKIKNGDFAEKTPKTKQKEFEELNTLKQLLDTLKIVKTEYGRKSVALLQTKLAPKIREYSHQINCNPARVNRYVNIYTKELVLLVLNNETQKSKDVYDEIRNIVNEVCKLIDDDINGKLLGVAIENESSISTLKQLLAQERSDL